MAYGGEYLDIYTLQTDSTHQTALSSSDSITLFAIMENGGNHLATYSRNILSRYGVLEYCEPIYLPTFNTAKNGEESLLSMRSQQEQVLHLFPNPTDGILNLVFNNSGGGKFSIYNSNGQVVYSAGVDPGLSQFRVDTQSLAKGKYFVQMLYIDGQTESATFIR